MRDPFWSFVLGASCALIADAIVSIFRTIPRSFRSGVIAATRGTHVAELVEQPDGTSEWVVREVEDE